MGYATGKLTDSFHFLRLAQLRFQPPVQGHILDHGKETDDIAAVVAVRNIGNLQFKILHLPLGAGRISNHLSGQDFFDSRPYYPVRFLRGDMSDFLADQFGFSYPEPVEIILIGEGNGFVFFNIGDAYGHRIQNKLEKGLAAAQRFLGLLALTDIRH